MRRRRLRFSGHLLLLQLAVIGAVVVVGFGLFGLVLARQLSAEYGQRALAIARSTAQDPELRAAVAQWSRRDDAGASTTAALTDGIVQRDAELVRARTSALFVVVTDDRGIRLAHPNPAELGRPVSTDPSEALAGREEIVQQTGTLGESARAKVPVFGPAGSSTDGVVVGAVSVGIDTEEIAAALWSDLRLAGLFAAGAIGLGVIASVLLSRRLRRLTLGLEPEDLAVLASEHEAVLGGIADGVLAVDARGTIRVANDEARRLFDVPLQPGTPVADAGLPAAVVAQLRRPGAEPATGPLHALAAGRVVVCVVRPVIRDGRPLGRVLSARDRTDVELLTRQLDAVQTVSTALRAQRHEFANRLHVVHGLLRLEHTDEAEEYVRTLLGSGPLATLLDGLETVTDPSIQAFLSAKAAHFRERSVTLRVGPQTWLPCMIADQVAVTTVLGNLLDNASDAAAAIPDGWVEVELLVDGGQLFVTVSDSGPGVPEALRHRLFDEGVTGHPDLDGTAAADGGGRGLGLALVRQVARALRGDVWLAHPGGAGAGATFVARLPGVLQTGTSEFLTQEGAVP